MNATTPNSYFDNSPEKQRARAKLPRGDRSRLAKRFFADLYAAWEEQGEAAIARAAFHDPMSFVRMVAGLMPQKLEIVHPTDGLTDERLTDLLALAERMAELKASGVDIQAHVFADEKRLIDVTPREGGGGPDRVGVAGGEGCPSSDRAAEIPETEETPNKLSDIDSSDAIRTPVGKPFATEPHQLERSNLAKLTEVDPQSLF